MVDSLVAMKSCASCKTQKPLSDFRVVSSDYKHKSGEVAYYKNAYSYCSVCHRAIANKLYSEAAERLIQYRGIDRFLVDMQQALKSRNMSLYKFTEIMGFNKKVIYAWVRGEKTPSKPLQRKVCDYLGLSYSALALTPNDNGIYPRGVRVCRACNNDFAVFKNQNEGKRFCNDCT